MSFRERPHAPRTVRRIQVFLWLSLGGLWTAWVAYSLHTFITQVPNMQTSLALDAAVTFPAFLFSMYTRGPLASAPGHFMCVFHDAPSSGECIDPSDAGFAVTGPFIIRDAGANVGWGMTLLPVLPLPFSSTGLPGAYRSSDTPWAIALRCDDAEVHSMTVQIYGTRYTDPFWRDTFINFREKDGAQLYNKIGATNIQARGYLRIDSGLNATGVQSFLNQHLYEEWLGVGQPFSKKPTETYYSIATTTYLGSDDTDLVWALGMNGTEGLLQSKEIMATFASFTVVKQSEQFSRSLLDVGNSILAPASVVLAIIVFMMGSGRYQPIGIVQKSFINPMGWVRRQYGISPLVSNDVDARLQNLEEFMDLLKDHYIEIHPSLLGGPASAQFQKTPQDA